MEIILIAAVDKKFNIGYKGKILWNNRLDRRIFRYFTKYHTVIMGRKTFDSIGRPLPDRQNIVISRKNFLCGCEVVSNREEAIAKAKSDKIFIIGGESIYRLFMPIANKIYLSIINVITKGDRVFPEIDESKWNLCYRKKLTGLEFRIYENIFMKNS